ncbi:MAG: ParA family protein [Acidimicrobiales bacterium]
MSFAHPADEFDAQSDAPVIRPITVAVANAKGGVGKTSIVANVCGRLAVEGLRVLAIDLDPQGNLAHDLGYLDRTDRGRHLLGVLHGTSDPMTLTDVRPGLDVWCGGPRLAQSVGALIPQTANPLEAALGRVADRYDVVLLDCPPSLGPLIDAALLTADELIVPIRADHASLHGLEMIGDKFREVRQANPGLELLGVTIFDVSRGATALAAEVAQAIRHGFGGENLRILPAIRRSERAAFEMRATGRLAHEYAADHASSVPAGNLADDYEALTHQVIGVLQAKGRLSSR